MKTRRSRIDWEAVKAHLSQNARRLEEAAQTDAHEMQQVFARRAVRLATRDVAERRAVDVVSLLRIRVGQQHCAVELAELSGIVPLRGYTPVPGTDAAVLGVMSVRGEVHAVIDPARLLDSSQATDSDATDLDDATGYAVLLRRGDDALGLYVQKVEQVELVGREELRPPDEADASLPLQYIKALDADGAAVLDITAIIAATMSTPDEDHAAPSFEGVAGPW